MQNFILLCLSVLFLSTINSFEPIGNEPEAGEKTFQWPNGAKAAVCLTYDDGLDCHIDIVRPDLNEFGFKGSFYCAGHSASLANRVEDWRTLVKEGHELGNHSLFHPCLKEKEGRDPFDWVKPEYDLNNYSVEQIVKELTLANTLLEAVDGQQQRTYAYTCSDYWVKEKTSFVENIKPLFSAARCDGSIPKSMKETDLYLMPSWGLEDVSGQEMIDYVQEAVDQGTIATFMFHSVGGGYLNVSREAHRELLEHLAANQDQYWVATFSEIAEYVKKEKERLGWTIGKQ